MESLNTTNPAVLEYNYGRGYDRLRYLLNHEEMGFSDYPSGEDNFILFNGSSGCMENFCSTFVDPDDIVIVEGPSFPGTVGTILKYRGDVREVSVDTEGASLEEIVSITTEERKKGWIVKSLDLIPDHQNPVGVIMSLSRRKEIA